MNPKLRAVILVGLLAAGAGPARATGLLETRAEIENYADASDFESALALGDELLAFAAEDFGDPSAEVGDAHTMIASLHAASGDFVAAETSLLAALDAYERTHGPLSTELIEPFLALGDNYRSLREHALAIRAYDEARSIGRRAYGLLNEAQIGIVSRMAEAAYAAGNIEEAIRYQEESLTIAERNHDEESPEILAAYHRHAEWLTDHYLFREAYLHYVEMRRMLRRHYDNDDRLLVELLLAQAGSFRRARGIDVGHRSDPHELEDALSRVEDLPEPDPALEARVLLELGDWNVAFDRGWAVADAYREAWEALGAAEDGEALREEWFSRIVPVYASGLSSRVLTSDPEAPWGRFEARFVVNAEGRAEGIEIVESTPPELLDAAATLSINRSRFRPRVIDGEPVASPGRVVWDYQYQERFVDDADESDGDGDGDGDGGSVSEAGGRDNSAENDGDGSGDGPREPLAERR